jgi:hypothetical protein
MLSTSKTYSVLPASDLARATAWFRDKLELEPEDTSEQGVRYRTGGDSWIYVYEGKSAWFQDSEGNYLCLTQPNTPM